MMNAIFKGQPDSLAGQLLKDLRDTGYCIARDLIKPGLAAKIDTELSGCFERSGLCSGQFYGPLTKRFGGVLKRAASSADIIDHDVILEIAETILGPNCDNIQLNFTQAIELLPGAHAQPPHRDQDMWGGPKGEMEYLINVIWPLTDFSQENGATILWPNSHQKQAAPVLPECDSIFCEMKPGDALIFLGSTLHAGGQNITSLPRRGIIVSYSLGWLKPYENMMLVYPPEVAREFPPEVASLLGYQIHRPNLGNVDGRCPSELLDSGYKELEGAVDHLQPEAKELISAYLAMANRDAV